MSAIRLILAALVFAVPLAAPCAAQQWAPGGVPLCQSCFGDNPRVVSDGVGGAYVGWRDVRNSDDVFLQRVTASGLIAPGWPASGLPVAVLPSVQEFSGLAPDGPGGALVVWEDWRNMPPATNRDPYVQRVQSNGSLPSGWALYGNPASSAPRAQYAPQVAPDGSGVAFVVWEDDRDLFTTGSDVYAQHLTADGAVAASWPPGGLALCALPGDQGGVYFAMPDDSGGAVFEWADGRNGGANVYAQRVRSDGTLAAGWTDGGIPIAIGKANRAAARDEAGGFYVASSTPGPSLGFDGSYYLLRFRFDGTPSPGWPAGGVVVCNELGNRAGIRLDADGTGGALLTWYDYRPPYNLTGGEIFAARVLADGALAAGWVVNGTLVSDPSDATQAYAPFVARDAQGGGYIAWQSQDSELPSFIQHLTPSGHGAPGWPQYGIRVSPSYGQLDTRVAGDGQGGAIVVWDEGCCGRNGIWAQRYGADGPTSVLASLVSMAAESDRVTLVWQLAGGIAPATIVYRRTATSSWDALGPAIVAGADRVQFEDRGVTPGGHYAYRLGWADGVSEQFSAETWVVVPNRLELALEGFRPNASSSPPTVAFTLPDVSPATLEAYDIAGRQVIAREVGSLGPGRHQVRLEANGLGPGVYHLRLRRGGETIVARGLILR